MRDAKADLAIIFSPLNICSYNIDRKFTYNKKLVFKLIQKWYFPFKVFFFKGLPIQAWSVILFHYIFPFFSWSVILPRLTATRLSNLSIGSLNFTRTFTRATAQVINNGEGNIL